MNAVQEAKRLVASGEFVDALKALDAGLIDRTDETQSKVLRAELLERVGQHESSRAQAEGLLKSRKLTPSERSACNLVVGRAETVEGQFGSAMSYLQRAVSLALTIGDHERASWAQLRLLALLSEHSEPDATLPLVAELRKSALRTGKPVIAAAVHVFVAQTEAKRGITTSASRHLRIAFELLRTSPNVWLEAMALQIQTAIAIMRADFGDALRHASKGVELAQRSGAAHVLATSHGNLANVLYLTGDYASAVEHQERAIEGFPARSDSRIAALDSLVRIRLAQQRLDDCDGLLGQIDGLLALSENRSRYVYRHALLTRANTWARGGRTTDALAQLDAAIHLAQRCEDNLLFHEATLFKTELQAATGRISDAIATMRNISSTMPLQPPNVYALYERALGSCLLKEDRPFEASAHLARAQRICESLHHAPALMELEMAYGQGAGIPPTSGTRSDSPERDSAIAAAVAEGIGCVIVHASRPELVARELVELLRVTGAATTASAVVHRPDGSDVTIATFSDERERAPIGARHRISAGATQDGTVDVVATLRGGVQPRATFDCLSHLMVSVQQLERLGLEEEGRRALWPVDELPDDKRSVISGRMRELMDYARRIACTKVNVLITGESGTGKEILARAIHDFSDRAAKPFVPFNCSAIPRDLLESQLFGHRRGAFTGADRDSLGLIRAAREGTLFLDEIGELGLDLQPKLLRFLESGEIAPLGEPGALTIDVRIVAATNANIEDAVRAGKFREDLFYRLNVVRLSIPPLRERRDEIPAFVNHFVARAADEFKKGPLRVADETMERLLLYRWPGNVRQLQNEMRRMVALAEPASTLMPDAIADDILGALPIFRRGPLNGREITVDLHEKLTPTLAHVECEMIKAALNTHRGKVNAAAKALGISRKGLYLKRRRLGL